MTVRILVFDTCAIVKHFVTEPGSETVRWIVRNRVQYGLNISVSTIARLEFECALWKKTAHGHLTIPQTRGILQRARGYFREVFRVRDTARLPEFSSGRPFEYNTLVEKYGLKVGRNDRDIWHLMCAHNYLRCFGGKSRPHVVTSDPNLKKMFKIEGYGVIDPIKQSPESLENLWK
jgi:hypothetical protein